MKTKQRVHRETNTSLGYRGEVLIQKVRSGKVLSTTKVKNTGCLALFEFLGNCLTLYSAENAERMGLFNSKPQYLNGFDITDNPSVPLSFDESNKAFRSYIKQSGISAGASHTPSPDDLRDEENSAYEVNIKFLLQDNNFISSNTKVTYLALYSGGNVNMLNKPHAYIKLKNSLDFQAGTNYIITWKLILSNKGEE